MKEKDKNDIRMAEEFADIKRTRTDKHFLKTRPPAAKAVFTRADERVVLAESLAPISPEHETGEEQAFCRAGVSPSIFRKLRRGRLAVEDEYDLHGMTVAQAKEYLHDCLADARRRQRRCVRVIHGKGKGSGQRGPVLKIKVNAWLRNWTDVVAFCSARPVDGGTGALYVLLKKN